jgi:hypothetical protein
MRGLKITATRKNQRIHDVFWKLLPSELKIRPFDSKKSSFFRAKEVDPFSKGIKKPAFMLILSS